MLQLAVVLKPKSSTQVFLEGLSLPFSDLPPQPGIAEIAKEMGLERPNSQDEQSIIILSLTVDSQLKSQVLEFCEHLQSRLGEVDFLLMPQSAQAIEVGDFILKAQELKEEPELIFINLIEEDERVFTLGMEAWSKPDAMINGTHEDSLSRLLEISLYQIQTGIQEKERVEFDSHLYRATYLKEPIQPEGLENPLGVLRFIKQV